MPESLLFRNTNDNLKEWYFVFQEPDRELPLWMRLSLMFTPKHLRHTFCFCQAGQFILIYEPHIKGVETTIKYDDVNPHAPISAYAAALIFKDQGWTVLRHRFEFRVGFMDCITNWVPSCTTAVKTASGFNCFALTPAGLLKALVKDGAEVL